MYIERAPLAPTTSSTNGKNCGFCGKVNHTEDERYLKKKMLEESNGDNEEAQMKNCLIE